MPTWARRPPRSLPGCRGELLGSLGADSTSLGLFASAQANRLDAGSKEFESELFFFFFNLGKRAVNDKRLMDHGKAVPII